METTLTNSSSKIVDEKSEYRYHVALIGQTIGNSGDINIIGYYVVPSFTVSHHHGLRT
jgi:hypothetical protein